MDETLLVVQIAIGLVFFLSATGKLLNPARFAAGVAEYRILPESLAFIVGLLVIPLEIFLGISHLSGWLLSFAVPIGLAMLASFMIAVATNLKRGRVLPCYCFGGGEGEMISGLTLVRLVLLFAAELLVLAGSGWSGTVKLTYPDRVAGFAELGMVFFWATFILVVAVWLLSIADVIALLRGFSIFRGRAGSAKRASGTTS
jgi:hypothetical protein